MMLLSLGITYYVLSVRILEKSSFYTAIIYVEFYKIETWTDKTVYVL